MSEKKITIKECVEFAVRTEEELSEYYEHLSEQCAEDKEISNLFKTLSKDEETHKKQFKALLKQVTEKEIELGPGDDDFLMAMSLSKTFAQLYGRHTYVYNKDKREQLLFELFEFEKATLGFYTALMDILGKDTVLKQIVQIEKRHVVSVMKMVVTGTKFTSMQDKWH